MRNPSALHRTATDITRWVPRPIGDQLSTGPARLEGVVLEYEPYGQQPKVKKRLDGLKISGAAPEWYGAPRLALTLRRAPKP